MKLVRQRITAIVAIVGISVLALSSSASAHVVVKPAEAQTASFQIFSTDVPNEKNIAVTSIRLDIPVGLKFVSPTEKAGWKIKLEKIGSGESATVKSITWSGGTIDAGLRDDFTFSGKVPAKNTELDWKVYQTYADGSVISWNQAEGAKESENSGPFSVTKVAAKSASDAQIQKAQQAVIDAKTAANRALYAGVAGVVIGLAGVYLATRKQ